LLYTGINLLTPQEAAALLEYRVVV
jgi:hypothetical protein